MGKINIDKFICSLIKYGDNLDNSWFEMALKDQGLSYDDGKLYENDPESRPKFKPGQWITDGNVNLLVTEVEDRKYFITAGDNGIYKEMSKINRTFHKWTIDDAKPGDIISSHDYIFIFKGLSEKKLHCERYCCVYKQSKGSEWEFDLDGNVYALTLMKPATKEEEEILFKTMKDNGYKWNKDTLSMECEPTILFTDLDGTLINTISENVFPEGIWDMKINFECLGAIKKMKPEYVFIVTNQGGIDYGYVSQESFEKKLNYVMQAVGDYCGCPCDAMYCESNDEENPYRKPNTEMLETLLKTYIEDYDVAKGEIKKRCLMIGDASGMAWQFSDSDKKTAINFGIDYMDVDDFIHEMSKIK